MKALTLTRPHPQLAMMARILWGSLFFAVISQVQVPLVPVPVTLQTLGVLLLGLFLGKKEGFFACCLYLVWGTVGLPVFPTWYVDPLWMCQPTVGFCVGFPVAAWVTGWLADRNHLLLSCLCGIAVLDVCGVVGLSLFVSVSDAITYGLLPFVAIDLTKGLIALALRKAFR